VALKVLVVDDAYEGQTIPVSVPGVALPVRAVDAGTVAPTPTWAQVLVAGATSGATNPRVDAGQALEFGAVASVDAAGTSLRLRTSGFTRASISSTVLQLSVPNLTWPTSVTPPTLSQDGPAGQPMTIQAAHGAAGGANGGNLQLYAGNGENGGELRLRSGTAIGAGDGAAIVINAGAGANGGTLYLVPGVATAGAPGIVEIEDAIGAPRLQCGSAGIAFNGGAPAIAPIVAGSRGGNVALADLLSQLDSMGLITDNTT
jgi:hypothetical protein